MGEWWESRKEAPEISSRNVKFTLRNGGMMRILQRGPWNLITECKIYTGKWGNDESPQWGPRKSLITECKIYKENGGMMRIPQGGPWKFLITECKIYTEKWGNDESPQWGPWKSLITECKIYTEKWGNDETPARIQGNFSSRNVKFTLGNGGMMRTLRFRKSERIW